MLKLALVIEIQRTLKVATAYEIPPQSYDTDYENVVIAGEIED